MEFSIKQGSPEKLRVGCIIVGVFENGKLSKAAQALDKAAAHRLSDIVAHGDMNGKAASTLLLQSIPGIAAERVLLVGLGQQGEQSSKTTIEILSAAFKALNATSTRDAAAYLTDEGVGPDAVWVVKQAVLIAAATGYRSDSLKSKPAKPAPLKSLVLATLAKPAASLKNALAQAVATAHGTALAKDLGNLPGNVCTPTYLANQAIALGKKHKSIKTTVLEEKDMQKLGMGALLSVTRGSEQPAKLITMEYQGASRKQKPIVLVGKGITFDSGGISLKPGA